MNLEHAIIALTKEVRSLSEETRVLRGRVDVLIEEVNRQSDELRFQGIMIKHLDAEAKLLIDGYGALGKKIKRAI